MSWDWQSWQERCRRLCPSWGEPCRQRKDRSPRDTEVHPESKREGRQVGGLSSKLLALNQFFAPTPYPIHTSPEILTQASANFSHKRPGSEDVSTREPYGLGQNRFDSKKATVDNMQTNGLGFNKTLFTESFSWLHSATGCSSPSPSLTNL